ncbi:MAG: phage tail protein [Syntrophomonas sp.]|nr:phage tail protein [Syntrophomonas sp.]
MSRPGLDPGLAFRFKVELDGLLVADFAEVSGLEAYTEVKVVREGGVNEYEHHFITIKKYPPLVLRRGFTNSTELWTWYEGTTSGRLQRKNGSIILLDANGQESFRWNFMGAYPTKWIGPRLQANASEVAIESLELVHQGLAIIKS